ncbi:serine hydrolase [Leptolyngbya sp. FACHB-261]|nr:serine hydrolase [Leptolyngbya sp. FACHB-261]
MTRSSRLRTRSEAKPRDKVTPETERSNSRQRSRKPQPSSVAPAPRTPARLRTKVQAVPPLLRALRLLVVGVGLGAIVGTLISIWNPDGTQHARAQDSHQPNPQATSQSGKVLTPLETQQELSDLKQQLQTLATAEPDLSPSVFVLDLDTKAYVDLAATTPFSAASTIKVPVLVAFLQDVDAGKIRLDELLEMRPDLIASEAGDMQYEAPGTKFTALEVADKMITVSDNTATNMLIDRLGGMAKLNERFASWGLAATAIRKPLPDLEGTNTTSARDLATLMNLVNQGDLLSLRSRDRMLEIMRRTVTNTLLSPGLGEGAIIAHKTGDIGSVVGDVGLIDMPNGKQYLATALVKRPHNDQRANELIRQMSAAIYTYLNQSPGAKSSTATPTATPAATQDVQ